MDLEVIQLGNPKLRYLAESITQVDDPIIQDLINSLLVIVQEKNGVGIAAPQIGYSLQLLIIASHPTPRYPHAPNLEPFCLINPQIIAHSDIMKKDWEGCLSVPGIRGLVPRYQQIEVEFINKSGLKERRIFTDFVARIFQHEFDHLQGLVFLDRVESNRDLITEAEYQKLVNNK